MENIRHFSRNTLCLSLNFHTSQETTCYSKCSWPAIDHTMEESILNANSSYTDTVLRDAWCLTVGISCTYSALAAAPLIFKLCMQCECGDVALQLCLNLALIQLHLETLFKAIRSHIQCALGFIGRNGAYGNADMLHKAAHRRSDDAAACHCRSSRNTDLFTHFWMSPNIHFESVGDIFYG